MTRYRLSGTVEEAHLSAVIGAYSAAGLRSSLDPEITLSLMPAFQAMAPSAHRDIEWGSTAPAPKAAPAPKRKIKRASPRNGAEWPAPGSIYDVVLQSIKESPKTPVVLREVLKAGGFSAGSVNSALVRLDKAGKAKNGEGGWIAT